VKGEKEVKGSDFELPTQVELASPEVHIATITDKKTEFEIEAQVEKGFGYLPVEKRKEGKLEIGQLPIDAIFTPIKKVDMHIENMRVGERTDFDKLTLGVETDGTITPEEAFAKSVDILLQHFSLLGESFKEEPAKPAEKKEIAVEGADEEVLKTKLEDLKLSTRTLNSLKDAGIATVGKIIKKTEASLLEVDGMGDKGIKEIKKVLKKLNLELKG
jgi:DNA-directed RNA polymerase subunit alpha